MNENVWTKKKILLVCALIILTIVVLILQIFSSKEKSEIEIVTSTSKFYTVSNCVYRYITYLQSQDVESLISVLDNSYKKSNGISKKNVIDKLDKLDSNYNFEARKMYQEILNDYETKYYVYGYLTEELMDEVNSSKQDYYVIVTLNSKKKTFSITPYDGEIFVDGGKNE